MDLNSVVYLLQVKSKGFFTTIQPLMLQRQIMKSLKFEEHIVLKYQSITGSLRCVSILLYVMNETPDQEYFDTKIRRTNEPQEN